MKNLFKTTAYCLLMATVLALSACVISEKNETNPLLMLLLGGDKAVNIAAIPGVVVPVRGEVPVTTTIDTEQYTGTISWSPADNPFAATTVYTATITLTAKSGYTMTGVTEDFFTVAGATSVTNNADSGVVTVEFPATGAAPVTVNIAAISGVTAPVLGASPVTLITETDQYTGTVTWDGGWAWASYFGGGKAYTATITLTAKSGYTLTGVAENFFTVTDATTVTNPVDSGVITAVFPATATVSVGDTALGGKVAYILQPVDPGYVAGEQRGLIAAGSDQSTFITWADAAVLSRAYTGGGYTDWRLPSKDELNKLYVSKTSIGGFDELAYYWSSSESSASYTWTQYFSNGNQYELLKSNYLNLRAVRVF